MMNAGFTLTLLGLLSAALVWIAIVDVRTYTISNGINLAIALVAPIYWLSAGIDLWPDAGLRVAVAIAVFLLFAVKLVVLTSLAGGALTLIVAGLHKYQQKEGRPEVPYGVAIAFGGLWLLAQRFLNHFA